MRVSGEGLIPSDLMILGEGPGTLESKFGRPFVDAAPAGAELSRYFSGYLLPHRSSVYITNLVKEWEGGAVKKKQEIKPADVARDEWELKLELLSVRPKLIVAMGGHATRWLLGPSDMNAVHGLLFCVMLCDFCGAPKSHGCNCLGLDSYPSASPVYVLPCYHVAAGLHQPEMAAKTAYDLNRLAFFLKLSSWGDLDQYVWKQQPNAGDYGVSQVLLPIAPSSAGASLIGLDTEGLIGTMWCMSGSAFPKEGKVYLASQLRPHHITYPCVFHNYMWDQQVLQSAGITIDEDCFHDTQLLAYLLGIEPQALKDLALRHLGRVMPEFKDIAGKYEPVYGKPNKKGVAKVLKKQKFVLQSLDHVDPAISIPYAAADADVTRQMYHILRPMVTDAGLDVVYEQDRRILPVYARMEHIGLPISESHFADFQADLAWELDMRTGILQADYPGLDPASPDKVAAVLFDTLKLPGAKKTPSGKRYTTNDKVLQSLKDAHPLVEQIIDWREVQKLKTTFVDNLPKYTRPARDGVGVRLHYRLLPTRVITGRLAAKDPNVLALPKHSALGQRFRAGIRAEAGRLLGSWDFDQIELRVLALDSQSPAMRDIFVGKQDLHARTAHRIFGVSPEKQDKSLHRLPAKAVNFGIPMGMTERGLAEQYRKNGYPWPELAGLKFPDQKRLFAAQAEVCKQHIKATIDDWGIESYLESKRSQARRYGYVTDMWGRRRFLANVDSPNDMVREEALRMAQSFPIQAGARGFYKTVVAKVWRDVIKPLQAEGYYIEPLLDVHDDLLLEFDASMANWLNPLIESYFNATFQLAIPITCKGAVGEAWNLL